MVRPDPAFTSSAESPTVRAAFVSVVLGLVRSARSLGRSAGLPFLCQSRRERRPALASFASLRLSSFDCRTFSARNAAISASSSRIHSTAFCRSISSLSSPSLIPAVVSTPRPPSPRAASVGSFVEFCSGAVGSFVAFPWTSVGSFVMISRTSVGSFVTIPQTSVGSFVTFSEASVGSIVEFCSGGSHVGRAFQPDVGATRGFVRRTVLWCRGFVRRVFEGDGGSVRHVFGMDRGFVRHVFGTSVGSFVTFSQASVGSIVEFCVFHVGRAF